MVKSIDLLAMLDTQVADLVASVRSSVVSVEGEVVMPIGSIPGKLPPAPPIFRPQYPRGTQSPPGSRIKAGGSSDESGPTAIRLPITGSGFLLPGGVVVTTREVAASMRNPRIRLADGRIYPGSGLICSAHNDVAIMRVTGLDPTLGLRWGRSSLVRAGNLALTLGNQDGFADTAALGMISSTERHARAAGNGRHYSRLIQFQGVPGAGGSGSPLLNTRGEVIGIVIGAVNGFSRHRSLPASALTDTRGEHPTNAQSTSGLPDGLARIVILGGMGLALPSDLVHSTVDALLKGECRLPSTGWLGVFPGPQTAAGLQIDAVIVGSPADLAGVRPGDCLVSIDGRPIHAPLDLSHAASEMIEGQHVTLDLHRGAQTLQLKLLILPLPSEDTIEKMPRRTLRR